MNMKRNDQPKSNHGFNGSCRSVVRWPRRFSNQKGQAMIELCLLLPLILLLLIGIIEMGRLAYYYIEVSDAARAGAQYASQSLADAANIPNITQAVQNDAQDIGSITLSPPPAQTCGCPGATAGPCPAAGCAYPLVYVKVTTTYPLGPLFQYPGISTLFPVTITGSSTMPVRQ
jgi:Flp pilus assembly protein TadG